MVGRELRSGRLIRLWRDDLVTVRRPPFDCGSDSLFVAFYVSAELGCFLALGWPLPAHILDLYAEHRCATNGSRRSMVTALSEPWPCVDWPTSMPARKRPCAASSWTAHRGPAPSRPPFSTTAKPMWTHSRPPAAHGFGLDLPRALLRGRYMAAVARMEWTGIPIDTVLRARLEAHWGNLNSPLTKSG